MNSFGIGSSQRVAIMIDGPNLFNTSKNLGFDVDFKKLLGLFEQNCLLHRAVYFNMLSERDDTTPVKPLVDWLSYNGYKTVTKPFREFTDASGTRRTKGSMHVEMAVEMMNMAQFVEHFVLFSGDGELAYAVNAVQEKGCRVTAVSTMKSDTGSTIADELRRKVNRFVNLDDVKGIIDKSVEENTSRLHPLRTTGHRPTMRVASPAGKLASWVHP